MGDRGKAEILLGRTRDRSNCPVGEGMGAKAVGHAAYEATLLRRRDQIDNVRCRLDHDHFEAVL